MKASLLNYVVLVLFLSFTVISGQAKDSSEDDLSINKLADRKMSVLDSSKKDSGKK